MIKIVQNTLNYALPAVNTEESRRMMTGTTNKIDFFDYKNKVFKKLTDTEKKVITETSNRSLDDEFWNDYVVTFTSEIYQMLDTSTWEGLIKYNTGLIANIIAPNVEEAKDVLNKCIFYVYNSETENQLTAEKKEKHADILTDLTLLKRSKEENVKLIYIACIALSNHTLQTPNEAYNELNKWLDGKDLYEKCDKLRPILDQDLLQLEKIYYVKKAIYHGFVKKNVNGYYANAGTQTEYAKNVEETINLLLTPKFEEELGNKDKSSGQYSIYKQVLNFEKSIKK